MTTIRINAIALSVAAILACNSALAQPGYQPSEENLASRREFCESRLGIFIHWGIYSMMGDGEWVQQNQRINYLEYGKLAGGFYPSKFNADEWVAAFKDAGAGYMTITSRHHDGFSMWHTRQSEYNIVDATPFHRDVLKELAGACARQDFRLHFYYSHLDWHRADYWPRVARPDVFSYGRPDGDENSWAQYEDFMMKQLEELLTGYGPLGALWFDGVWDKVMDEKWVYHHGREPEEFNIYEQYEMIHRLQPGCLVGNNHHTSPFPGEDIEIFERDVPGANENGCCDGQEVAENLPLETCTTMNESWGYNINDHKYKSVEDVLTLLVRTASKDANLLINIGPRPDGTLPDEAMAILKGMGEWMRRYGNESIKGTRGGFAAEESWGVQTRKDNVIYVHILNPVDTLELPYTGVAKVTTFEGEPVKFSKTKTSVSFAVPARPSDTFDQIIKVVLK